MASSEHTPILPSEWEGRNSPSSILPSFFKAIQGEDYPKRLQGLYRGLSEKDKGAVSRMLNCFHRLFSGEQPQTIFSPSECKEIDDYLGIIRDREIKIREDLYCFNGYFLPIPHFAPDLFISRLHYDSLADPGYIRGKDIIDAGGYVGDSALIMSSWTDGRVHVFEPISGHIAQFEKTAEYNDLRNVTLVPNGLGEFRAELEIAFFGSGSSISKFTPDVFSRLRREKIQIIPLDEYVREHDLKVGFIKIDVEGYEQPLLRGALETIRTQRPILSVSIYHNADDFFGVKPLIEELDLGYKFKIAKVPNGGILVETALIAEPEA
jgi:FkbM family methyltransferase